MLGLHTPDDLSTAQARRRGSIPMFSTTARPAFPAWWSDFEAIGQTVHADPQRIRLSIVGLPGIRGLE